MATGSLTANILAASFVIPSVSNVPDFLDQITAQNRRVTSIASTPFDVTSVSSEASIANVTKFMFDDITRATTESEKIVGELRGWTELEDDWDGEGAASPSPSSINQAVAFVRSISNVDDTLQPMLHANGNVSLYWNNNNLYADVEFLGNERIAYFIKVNSDKHKGVISFNTNKIPDVLLSLLGIKEVI